MALGPSSRPLSGDHPVARVTPPPLNGGVHYYCHHRTWAEDRSARRKVGSCCPPSQLVLCLLVQINLDTGWRSPGRLLMEHELEGARVRHRHRNKLPETGQMSQELLPGYGKLGTPNEKCGHVKRSLPSFRLRTPPYEGGQGLTPGRPDGALVQVVTSLCSWESPICWPKRASDCAADRWGPSTGFWGASLGTGAYSPLVPLLLRPLRIPLGL